MRYQVIKTLGFTVLLMMMFGLAVVPMASQGVRVPAIGSEHPEYGTYLGLDTEGDPRYKMQIPAGSKASMLLSPDNVEKRVWDDKGDGEIGIEDDNPFEWNYDSSTMDVGVSFNLHYEVWISFAIGDTFRYSTTIKSLDDVDLMIKCEDKYQLEGSEEIEIKEMGTNNQCGKDGDSDCNSYTEIFEMGRSGSKVVATSEFDDEVWERIDITANSFLDIGDYGQLNLYLEEDGFSGAEHIEFYSSDSANNPYLDIDYTVWSAPTANAVDITGEPTYLLPWQNYEVQTICADADGRTNLNDCYLYISADHSSYLVRMDWDRATDTFSQGLGAEYVVLNVSGCSSAENGANGYALNWNVTVTADWQEGYIDWANYATDAQGKNSGLNWNNQNTWHTDRLWLYDLDVHWISEGTYLEDGDYVYTSNVLNITGYVYWNQLTTVYDLGQGTPLVDLWVDGVDLGGTYNDSIDASGYFNITYTTPASEDWDWSLDIVLDNLPTGLTEGPSNDNGKNPLFLIAFSSAAFGASGTTVTLTIQPLPIVPYRETGYGPWYLHLAHGQYGYHVMLTDDGTRYAYRTGASSQHYYVEFEYQSPYWMHSNNLNYDFEQAGAGCDMHDYNPTRVKITDYLDPTGSHATEEANWFFGEGEQGRLQIGFYGYAGTPGSIGFYVDYLAIDFNSFTETRIAERTLNDTVVIDMVEINVKAPNTNVSITGLPTTYSYSHMVGNSSYEDNVGSTGSFKLYNTHVGTYQVYFDTGMTWHEVAFSPTLPDGLSVDWQVFEWYINETQINKMPYPMTHGFYNLRVQDGFHNDILLTDFTIASTDAIDLIFGYDTLGVIPLYELAIPNKDDVDYSIDLTRGDDTSSFPLIPFGETQGIRVYGITAGTDYTLSVYEVDGINRYLRTEYTISMPDHAHVEDAIDLIEDEIIVEFYNFEVDDNYCYLNIRTKDGGTSVTIAEDGTEKFAGYGEDTDFRWLKSDTNGVHIVNVTATKSGYADLQFNSSYVVREATLYILSTFQAPRHDGGSDNITMFIETNWGNCTIEIKERYQEQDGTWGDYETLFATKPEGAISWSGTWNVEWVEVTITVDGGAQTLDPLIYIYSSTDVVVKADGGGKKVVEGDTFVTTKVQVPGYLQAILLAGIVLLVPISAGRIMTWREMRKGRKPKVDEAKAHHTSRQYAKNFQGATGKSMPGDKYFSE